MYNRIHDFKRAAAKQLSTSPPNALRRLQQELVDVTDNPIEGRLLQGGWLLSLLYIPNSMTFIFADAQSAAERWNPAHGVRSILLSVISMLNEPNISSPANVDASVSYRKYKENGNKEFPDIIKKMVEKSKAEAAKDGVKVPETEEEYVIKARVKRQQAENEGGTDNGDVGLEEEFYDA
uniref:UBC core domain-containing protein n=1 Tax=Meloidogyne floridensis TaxID=298350 RepID=A0A915P655_9BILA